MAENVGQEKIRFNHPDDLHLVSKSGRFGKLKFIATQEEAMNQHRALYASEFNSKAPAGSNITVASAPRLLINNQVSNTYKTNNWQQIKKLKDQANQDLMPIYTNLQKFADSRAWVGVQEEKADGGEIYYMCYDNRGNYVWSYCPTTIPTSDPNNPKVSFNAPTQFGQYSYTTSIAGIHSYNINLTTKLTTSAISLGVGIFAAKILSKGLNFTTADLTTLLTDGFAAVTDINIDIVFGLAAAAAPFVCFAVVFLVVFIGLQYLWGFLNKQFQIEVSVYNWDKNNDWNILVQALSNSINPGQDTTSNININIKEPVSPGEINPYGPGGAYGLPPSVGSHLLQSTQTAINYAYIVYKNQSTFMQGNSFAFNCVQGKSNKGFTYAFECPWTASNGHYMDGTSQDPNAFLKKGNWIKNTSPLTVNTAGVSIEATIDSLKGGDVNGSQNYQVAIHIAKNQ